MSLLRVVLRVVVLLGLTQLLHGLRPELGRRRQQPDAGAWGAVRGNGVGGLGGGAPVAAVHLAARAPRRHPAIASRIWGRGALLPVGREHLGDRCDDDGLEETD